MGDTITKLCFGCMSIREIFYVEPSLDRGYCAQCVVDDKTPLGSMIRAMEFLSLTVPFKVGDRVEARTAGEIYDGIGTVTEVDIDFQHGGTPVYPTFTVVIDEPASEESPRVGHYTEVCLAKVNEREPVAS